MKEDSLNNERQQNLTGREEVDQYGTVYVLVKTEYGNSDKKYGIMGFQEFSLQQNDQM